MKRIKMINEFNNNFLLKKDNSTRQFRLLEDDNPFEHSQQKHNDSRKTSLSVDLENKNYKTSKDMSYNLSKTLSLDYVF